MKKWTFYILICSIVLISFLNIILILRIKELDKIKLYKQDITLSNVEESKSPEEIELERLQKMTERDRIEYYFSKFINLIKDEEYEKAYNLLYPEFKENYFKTQQEFETYVKKIYPKSVGFSYNNIDRQGNIYILMITVIDTNKRIGEEKSQRIVVKENGINDFVLSFQVI